MNLRNLVDIKTNSIFDPEFTKAFKQMPVHEWFEKNPPFDCRNEYIEKIHNRILSSNLNTVFGLDKFTNRHVVNGTTQTFDDAFLIFKGKRLRTFRGEYAYHSRIVKNRVFLEDDILRLNDYIIISVPFCSTGDLHPEFYNIINQAQSLNVPVIIDCAYWWTCWGLEIDFSNPAIEQVTFSLSKSLGLGDMRSGIRYSNNDLTTPVSQQHNYNHLQLLSLRLGIYMMDQFDPDFIPNKYKDAQESICKDLGITPTKCMHLALGNKEWDEFKIDDRYNRLGIRQLVKARYKGQI